jgi:hypothetical protein
MSIERFDRLADVVRARGELYLRYSHGPTADAGEESRDYESGLRLPGLSVVPLAPPEWWTRPIEDWLARQIRKYAELGERGRGRYAWILTGEVSGIGPDHEPLVVDVRPLAVLSDSVLCQACRRYHDRFEVGRDSLQ